MPDAPLPPCGPERDRLAAHAVGWEWPATVAIGPETTRVRYPSTTDADALALLEAWVTTTAATTRGYGHKRFDGMTGHVVTLTKNRVLVAYAGAPTLGDAATAAVIYAERGYA